ncbi:MAG TPA: dihydropteroate synthase [Candidatus Hydrogenedentes bacterium]|nr:dihydropteroate synthase [Candidatus Hydrogenedentota bacterium]
MLITALGRETLVMGVLNVTPDSFSDGGQFVNVETAVARARAMVADGAHLIDVGGESSRPGAEAITPALEQARVLPVIDQLAEEKIPFSIDTYHADTARRALALGAGMVNDITALRGDPAMVEVVAEAGCACVLMHMLGTPKTMQESPHYDDVVDDLCKFFEERIHFATKLGVREEHIWIDPGFGFGKTPAHNLEVLRRLAEFRRLGRPILIGTSNKSTIGVVLEVGVDDRMEGTAATVAIAIANGADAVRVHDVRRMARVARMADAIIR